MPRSIPSRPAPLALSLSLFASFSAPALAADPVEQQMVVIGSRAPTSISELPGTVWVIEREQLDQQTQAGVPLKEALGQLIPGLDIGSQGRTNNGQNLRGRSVLVMIDGVSLNSSRGISRQFDSIDPFNIERIEVMS
ncbi:TonB-dependent receptor plug domain-containing protein, partial [Pseudomonas aeruginosa]